MFTIRKLSQSFVIHDPPSGVVHYLTRMVNSQLNAPKLNREHGRVFISDGDGYYFVDMGRNDHYYSIAQYDLVIQAIEMAKSSHYVGNYEVIEYDPNSRKSADVKFKNYKFDLMVSEENEDIFEFYGWQNEVSTKASEKDRYQTIFEIQTGLGKFNPNSEPILTPFGWVPMGEIRPGSLVIGRDGSAVEVLKIFPQGVKDIYRVVFEDGRYSRCGLEHLWETNCGVLDTSEIIARMDKGKEIDIPMFQPENYHLLTKIRFEYEKLLRDKSITHCSKSSSVDYEEYVTSKDKVLSIKGYVESLGGKTFIVGHGKQFKIKVHLGPSVTRLKIVDIIPCGEEECTCISVDAIDELYVTRDYLVTHNTKCFQKVQVRTAKRTLIITKSGYVPKWRADSVTDDTGLNEPGARVRVVSGVAGIEALFKDAQAGVLDKKNISTIIIGTVSLKMWLKERSAGNVESNFPIYEFYDILGVGLVGYDEIHEHFHTIYLAGITLNPPKTVEMSATLKPGNSKDFIKKRYLERFPINNRLNIPYYKVVRVAYVYYNIYNNYFKKRLNSLKMYSHNEFEKMIYKCGLKNEYFDMVYELLVKSFFSKYEKGQRAIVFFSLIQTCTDFTEYLNKKLKEDSQPNLKVRRYIGSDKYSDLMESEIAVSTPGKAGTAVDLPKLTTAIVTTAIDDRQLNEQITGRPRKLKDWPDRDPMVLFLHCSDIGKHHKYLKSRKEALAPVVISSDVVSTSYRLRGNGSSGNNIMNKPFNINRASNKINSYKEKVQRKRANSGFRPKRKSKNKFKSKKRSRFSRWS